MRIAVVCAFGSVMFAALATRAGPPAKSADAAAACASGSAAACRELGDRALDRKDHRAASDRYEQGCKLDDGESCARLGFAFLNGEGRPKDPAKAAALFEQACGKLEAWCGMLGQLYADANGVERDAVRALQLLRRGCVAGVPIACGRLGTMLADGYGTVIDELGALAALDEGCRGKNARACFVLGNAYERGELGLERRAERGRSLMTHACTLGDAEACSAVKKLCAADPKPCGKPLASAVTGRLRKLHESLVTELLGKSAGCDEIAAQGRAFVQAHARDIDDANRELDRSGRRGFYLAFDDDLLGKLLPVLKTCPDGTMTVMFDAGLRPPAPIARITAPAEAPPLPDVPVPKGVTAQDLVRVVGEKVILPDAATKSRIARQVVGKLIGVFKLCINTSGDVAGVQRLRSTGFPAYDATLEAGIRAWKYRPVMAAGQAVPVCTRVAFAYTQN